MGFWEYPAFALLGLGVGIYGTLVGLGGGFIVVPVLLLVYHASPQAAAGTSLAVMLPKAISGTLSYLRQGRVDLHSGVKFALATIPGAVLGAYLSIYLTSRPFSLAFGLLMLAASAVLIWRPAGPPPPSAGGALSPKKGQVTRRMVDSWGNVFTYTFNERIGIVLSLFAGFLSSILGIGGGIVHVPALIQLLAFPAHIATATSVFILAVTTGVGATSHLFLGDVLAGPALSMAAGAVVGAQMGAALARRLKGSLVVRLLSLALVAAGARLILAGLGF